MNRLKIFTFGGEGKCPCCVKVKWPLPETKMYVPNIDAYDIDAQYE